MLKKINLLNLEFQSRSVRVHSILDRIRTTFTSLLKCLMKPSVIERAAHGEVLKLSLEDEALQSVILPLSEFNLDRALGVICYSRFLLKLQNSAEIPGHIIYSSAGRSPRGSTARMKRSRT